MLIVKILFSLTMSLWVNCYIIAKIIFTDIQLMVMKAVLPKLEPKSPRYTKGRNPDPPNTFLWAAWMGARLGGWKGRMTPSERPSYIVIHRGWEQLETMSWGAELILRDVSKD